MLWKTHIWITRDVVNQLRINLTDEEWTRLKDGVIAPDNFGNYPHHYGKDNEVRYHLDQARAYFLQNNMLDAYYNLGIALHYVQDSYTTYPSFLPKHQEWEEWIENSNFVYDIHGAIQTSNMNIPMKSRCAWLAQQLSRDVCGRSDTFMIATMNEAMKDNNTIASPKVDLNLGLMASYAVTKSILGPTTNPALDAVLINNLNQFEGHLRAAEANAASELVRLVNERNEMALRLLPPKGFVAKMRNWLTNRKVKAIDSRAIACKQSYLQRRHLDAVASQYWNEVRRLTAEHVGWYDYRAPLIDTNIVTSELVEVQTAAQMLGLGQQSIRELLIEHNVPICGVGGSEIVERSRVDELTTSIMPKML